MNKLLTLTLPLFFLLSCQSNPSTPSSPPPPTTTTTLLPNPCPSPATCPPARVWKIGIRECADVAYGEGCLMDTTPFFLGGRCNVEDREACSNLCGSYRECEPDYSRGPDFNVKVLSGSLGGWVRNSANPYQIRLLGVKGRIRVQACWYEGASDQEGVLLDLSGASCGTIIVVPQGYEG